ncbi:MAG: DUF1573 domain-containing protein [Bacteroidetes bacterium]|nr:DUF1573 domain-containing protein [Bacteroidota bacterium]HET6244370.1 DUF1573 domain-containing protein [Bacteroidia bacterium]
MNHLRAKIVAICLGALFIVSCEQDKTSGDQKITTDLINIPVNANGITDTINVPSFNFESTAYDFGVITQGEKISFSYKFINSGKTNLIITSAKGSCGCTVPEYPKKPIPPNGEGKIEVVFDSDGKSGKQNKTVTLLANTYPATTVLNLTGEIIAPNVGINK